MTTRPRWPLVFALVMLVLSSPFVLAQSLAPPAAPARAAADTARAGGPANPALPSAPGASTPATSAAPAAPASPVSGMRNKISAGDLLSAESMLEVHRDKHGEDGPYLAGLSWLARGALLLGEYAKAGSYAADVRARCDRKLAAGDTLERNRDLETALGASIEVRAQLIEHDRGAAPAAAYLRSEIPKIKGPASLRSRLYKRLNMLTLVGQKAPEVAAEDRMGEAPSTLAGQPTLMFLWAEWCGDCKAQAASLSKVRRRWEKEGVRFLAVTRYYDPESLRVRERARVDSVWKADYAELAGVPVVFSTASMERYGVSSTPTFAFIDRAGIVRRYTPTRLTEAEFDRTLTRLVKPLPGSPAARGR
jgi:thiol-disulfide isomerase/thioredoxin